MKFRMILSLTITCLLSAALLAFVYQKTDPKIKGDIIKKNNFFLISALFPTAKNCSTSVGGGSVSSGKDILFWTAYDSAGKIINTVHFENILPDTLWFVTNTANNKIAIIFKVSPQGYSGKIPTLVALSLDTSILGIRPATPSEGLKETPRLGTKINELWFKKQFIGKKRDDVALKQDGGALDAITSATISSRAVTNGVRDGIERYKKYLSNPAQAESPATTESRHDGDLPVVDTPVGQDTTQSE